VEREDDGAVDGKDRTGMGETERVRKKTD